MRVFVTVGSTSFDALVAAALGDDVLRALRAQGCVAMVVQFGRGTPCELHQRRLGVDVTAYDFKPSLEDDMRSADLVLSHAGSGSIMEGLRMGKRLVVVINEELMDNHQRELAEALAAQGHLSCATVRDLREVIERQPSLQLRPFPDPQPQRFAQVLDAWFGHH